MFDAVVMPSSSCRVDVWVTVRDEFDAVVMPSSS